MTEIPWASCLIPGCAWRTCRALHSQFCFEHTVEAVTLSKTTCTAEQIRDTLHTVIDMNHGTFPDIADFVGVWP